MRILFVSTGSGSRGGGELFLLRLGEALCEYGIEVALWTNRHSRMDELCNRFSSWGEVLRGEYTNTYDTRFRGLAPGLSARQGRQLLGQWMGWKPDIIQLNKQNLEDGLDLLDLIRKAPVPHLCLVHLTQPARHLGAKLAWLRDWHSARHLRKYNGTYVALTPDRRDELIRFCGDRLPIEVIPNGVTVWPADQLRDVRAAKRAELGLAKSERLMLAVGRMWEQKQPLRFLEWAHALRKRNLGDRFLWIGEGHLEAAWDAHPLRRELEGIVSRIGWQNDVTPFLAAADVLLHPARYEGYPFAVLEAMSCGLPCVLTPEVAGDAFRNEQCYLVAEGDWLERFPVQAQLAAIGEAARSFVQTKCSIAAMRDRYLSLYRGLKRSLK